MIGKVIAIDATHDNIDNTVVYLNNRIVRLDMFSGRLGIKGIGYVGSSVLPWSDLKTFVVEYQVPCKSCKDDPYKMKHTCLCRGKAQYSRIPLKHSQWQLVIDGKIKTNVFIEFEIQRVLSVGGDFEIAEIIEKKKDWEMARKDIESALGTHSNDLVRGIATNIIQMLNKKYPLK